MTGAPCVLMRGARSLESLVWLVWLSVASRVGWLSVTECWTRCRWFLAWLNSTCGVRIVGIMVGVDEVGLVECCRAVRCFLWMWPVWLSVAPFGSRRDRNG